MEHTTFRYKSSQSSFLTYIGLVKLNFKQYYEKYKATNNTCSKNIVIHGTIGLMCGHIEKNTKIKSLYKPYGFFLQHVLLLWEQQWFFNLQSSLGLNITIFKLNLTMNCPHEIFNIVNWQTDSMVLRFCGRNPQQELLLAFTSIGLNLFSFQFMPHFTEKLILSFQIFDNTHVITRKYRSLDAAEYFLHKSFIFAAREVLDVFSMRMSNTSILCLRYYQSLQTYVMYLFGNQY